MVLSRWKTFQIAANTSVGAQALSTPIGGLTPKAVAIEMTRATASALASHAVIAAGISDGTTSLALSPRSEDSVSTTDTGRRRGSSMLVQMVNATNNNRNAEADFVSFDTDEVNITWVDPPSSAFLMNVTVFYGELLQAAVVEHEHENTADPSSITGLSFAPNVAFCWSSQSADFPDPAEAEDDWIFHHGMAVDDDGVIRQTCFSSRELDGAGAASVCARIQRNDAIAEHLSFSGFLPSYDGQLELTSFDSGGITVEPSAAGMGFAQAYLLLDVGDKGKTISFQDIETGTTGTGSPKKITTDWRPTCGRLIGSSITVA